MALGVSALHLTIQAIDKKIMETSKPGAKRQLERQFVSRFGETERKSISKLSAHYPHSLVLVEVAVGGGQILHHLTDSGMGLGTIALVKSSCTITHQAY